PPTEARARPRRRPRCSCSRRGVRGAQACAAGEGRARDAPAVRTRCGDPPLPSGPRLPGDRTGLRNRRGGRAKAGQPGAFADAGAARQRGWTMTERARKIEAFLSELAPIVDGDPDALERHAELLVDDD